jgi:hypothetical protein
MSDREALYPWKDMRTFEDRIGKKHTFDAAFINLDIVEVAQDNSEAMQKIASDTNSLKITKAVTRALYELTAAVCSASDPELTYDFLKKEVHIQVLIPIARAVWKNVQDYMSKSMEGGGGEAQEKTGVVL